MAGPWELFQEAPQEPWANYAPAAAPQKPFTLMDTWPARMARDVYEFARTPIDIGQGKFSPQPETPGVLTEEDVARQRFVQEELRNRAMTGAALLSPINPAVRSGGAAVAGASDLALKRQPPTQKALIATGAKQIDDSANMGVEFQPNVIRDMGAAIESELQQQGFNDKLAPKTFGILSELRTPPDDAVATIGNIQTLRRTLSKAAESIDNTERGAAVRAIRGLDRRLSQVPDESVLAQTSAAAGAGPAVDQAKAAAALYKSGRDNYAAGMRSAEITGKERAAELRAAAANSGLNLDNANRQRIASVLIDDAGTRGYSPKEIAQMERVVRGAPLTNAMRYVGNLFGGGGGLGQAVTGGIGAAAGAGAAGMPGAFVGAATPAAIGAIAKRGANALTSREMKLLDAMIRQRSPLAAQMPQVAPYPTMQDALIRALMLAQQGQQ